MKLPNWLETIFQAVKDTCLISVARQDVTRAEYERDEFLDVSCTINGKKYPVHGFKFDINEDK